MNLVCNIGQCFGGNANPFYKGIGLKGHTGWDENCGWGTDIASYVNGKVYSLYTPDKPASDGFTAIYTLVETPLETFEFCVGHVSQINVKIGDNITKGQIIGKEGNHGVVYSGGQLITLAMQAAGDHRGNHRHNQKRCLVKSKTAVPGKTYLSTVNGLYFDGNYYEIVNYNNGYNGCVDFMAPLFNRDLYVGTSGYDVLLLQRALVLEGFATFEPQGDFGPKTFSAVKAFQKAHNLPATGYLGRLTRGILNTKYTQL